MIWIVFGTLLVSLSLSYAWWIKVRVVCLRQDIYDIRDELFDAALELDAFSDSAYFEARDHFNHIAKTAHLYTIPFLVVSSSQSKLSGNDSQGLVKSQNPKLQERIDLCIEQCAKRIYKYLVFETLTGWCVYGLAQAVRLKKLVEAKGVWSLVAWLKSSSPEEISGASSMYRNMKKGGMPIG